MADEEEKKDPRDIVRVQEAVVLDGYDVEKSTATTSLAEAFRAELRLSPMIVMTTRAPKEQGPPCEEKKKPMDDVDRLCAFVDRIQAEEARLKHAQLDLDKMEAAMKEATNLPWWPGPTPSYLAQGQYHQGKVPQTLRSDHNSEEIATFWTCHQNTEANAKFASWAVNSVPAFLAEIRMARKFIALARVHKGFEELLREYDDHFGPEQAHADGGQAIDAFCTVQTQPPIRHVWDQAECCVNCGAKR